MGQQQVTALCDISAQVQQYQQFLGEQHALCRMFLLIVFDSWGVVISPGDEDRDLPACPCCCVLCRGIKAAAGLYRHACA